MEMDWRHRITLSKLSEGCTYSEAATVASISRMTFWRWVDASPVFAEAVLAARQVGKDQRTFRLWLRHPFRGKRPPTGKGHGGAPRFSYGRR
jgi:hypothetical protein